MDQMTTIIAALRELEQDPQTPKNIKTRIASTITTLAQEGEPSLKAAKALEELEALADDSSVQPYTRTQLFNIVSLLELV